MHSSTTPDWALKVPNCYLLPVSSKPRRGTILPLLSRAAEGGEEKRKKEPVIEEKRSPQLTWCYPLLLTYSSTSTQAATSPLRPSICQSVSERATEKKEGRKKNLVAKICAIVSESAFGEKGKRPPLQYLLRTHSFSPFFLVRWGTCQKRRRREREERRGNEIPPLSLSLRKATPSSSSFFTVKRGVGCVQVSERKRQIGLGPFLTK